MSAASGPAQRAPADRAIPQRSPPPKPRVSGASETVNSTTPPPRRKPCLSRAHARRPIPGRARLRGGGLEESIHLRGGPGRDNPAKLSFRRKSSASSALSGNTIPRKIICARFEGVNLTGTGRRRILRPERCISALVAWPAGAKPLLAAAGTTRHNAPAAREQTMERTTRSPLTVYQEHLEQGRARLPVQPGGREGGVLSARDLPVHRQRPARMAGQQRARHRLCHDGGASAPRARPTTWR